jgi:uncharacterized protein YndB with AHSA1/START domain
MTDQIERELELTAPVAVVWRALTDPEWLSEWLAEDVALELTPGGEARFVIDGELRSGWVEEVCPPREGGAGRIAFWWQADGEPASRVLLELEPIPHGSRVRVTETRPLEVLDLVGIPLRGAGGARGGPAYGPALVA